MPPRNPLISLPGRKIPSFRSGNCIRAYPEFPDGHYFDMRSRLRCILSDGIMQPSAASH